MEEPRDELPLGLVETTERALEVLLDDPARATEVLREGLRAQNIRAASALLLPDPLHHELEIRRLDPTPPRTALDDPTAREPTFDPARRDLVDDRRHERRLGHDVRAADRLELGQWFHDRGAGGIDVKVIEAEHVPEQPGHPSLECVKIGERVIPDAEQDVHAQCRPSQDLRERIPQRPTAVAPVETKYSSIWSRTR